MIETMKAIPENMYKAAGKGFINATDLADYLVGKGLPFRSAYKIVGSIVARCIKDDAVLDELPLEVYKEYDSRFESDLYDSIKLEACVNRRISAGGTGLESVDKQIAIVKEIIK